MEPKSQPVNKKVQQKFVCLRVSGEVHARLKADAALEGRSIQEIVTQLIEERRPLAKRG
jgi:predicted HicB family RNase H-like nuclease